MSKSIGPVHPQDRLMYRVAMVDNWTLKEIGTIFGHISRQRVSQRIHRVNKTPLDPNRRRRSQIAKIISVCERSLSLGKAAKNLCISRNSLSSILKQLGLLSIYKKIWKVKNKQIRKKHLIRVMKLIARRVGHTPSIDEVNAFAKGTRHRRKPIPFHTAWCDAFGSFREAQISAGLIPNSIGHPSKQKVS